MPKEAKRMQPDSIDVTKARQQQHTGNHDKPGPERGGSDRHGGTRHGAENVESARPSPVRKPNKERDPHSCAASGTSGLEPHCPKPKADTLSDAGDHVVLARR